MIYLCSFGDPIIKFPFRYGPGLMTCSKDKPEEYNNWLRNHAGFVDTWLPGRCGDWSEALGVGEYKESYVAVLYNKKKALLHRYITWWESSEMPPGKLEGSDIIFFPEEAFDIARTPAEALDIRMNFGRLHLSGYMGSVVVYDGDLGHSFGESICTLYDFLVHLCRHIGLNIMAYKRLQFSGVDFTHKEWHAVIDLLHNAESERYFTKMWLDVIGDYKTGLES